MPPLYDGIAGLEASDPSELAATLFLEVFPPGSSRRPVRSFAQIATALVQLSGVRQHGISRVVEWLGLSFAQQSGPAAPFLEEAVAAWTRVGLVAVRSGRHLTLDTVVLLRAGLALLRSGDVRGDLLRLLG